MQLLLVVLRFAHIVAGTLWVGMMVYTVVFLTPAVREAGPTGATVIAALQRRRVMTVMPILALATIASGMLLFSRLAGGAPLAILQTATGFTFALGGASSLIAFVIAVAVMRPAMVRGGAIMASLGSATTEERAVRTADIQRLRVRADVAGRAVALLLIIAAGAMAVARYI